MITGLDFVVMVMIIVESLQRTSAGAWWNLRWKDTITLTRQCRCYEMVVATPSSACPQPSHSLPCVSQWKLYCLTLRRCESFFATRPLNSQIICCVRRSSMGLRMWILATFVWRTGTSERKRLLRDANAAHWTHETCLAPAVVNVGGCPTYRTFISSLDDETVPQSAARNGDYNKVQRLLRQGIRSSPRDLLDSTSLLAALKIDHYKIVHLLLQGGAYVIELEQLSADGPILSYKGRIYVSYSRASFTRYQY